MAETIFTEFFRKAGFRVFASPSAEWIEVQPGVLLSTPYHRLINPPDEELDELIARAGAFVLRYPTEADNYGFDSHIQFCRTEGYGLEHLKRQARQQVKKGESHFIVRELADEDFVEETLQLIRKTCCRQRRHDPKEDPECWARLCDAAKNTPGAVRLGVFGEKGLAATLFILETPTAAEFIVQCSDSEMLPLGVNNVLTYHATRRYLAERNPPLPVCYGLGSLEETPSLDQYKVTMGYVLEPIKQRLYVRRGVRWLINRYTLGMLEAVGRLGFAKNYRICKATWLWRRYLEQYAGQESARVDKTGHVEGGAG